MNLNTNQRTQAPLVGRPVKRIEDPRLITGAGRYLEDIALDGMLHVALLRSPHAHARILSIDAEHARNMPGVVDIVVGDDLQDVGSVPVSGDLNIPEQPPLARGTVRFVGDPVLAVIAESSGLAADALEAITVQYETLPAVLDPRQALEDSTVLVHPEFETNVVTTRSLDTGGVDAAFDDADYRLDVHLGHSRVAALPIENRGGLAHYTADTDRYTLWLSTQAAWNERTDLASALNIPEERLHVITPDVGGAFGAKMTVYRETLLLLALAQRIGRPVRWIATRTEDLQASMHGRDTFTDAEVAFDKDGHIRALRLRTVANFGAYLMRNTAGPPMRMLYFPTGAYAIPEVHSEVIGVFTNSGLVGPYRGAGRPEAAYFIERVINEVAHELGMDQVEIRQRNFVAADAFPYTNAAGVTYDSGNYQAALERVLELVGIEELKADIECRRAAGELVGMGLSSCVEVSGGGHEQGEVRLGRDGKVVAITGSSPHGQGLATSFAQIIADELGIDIDHISVQHGDTDVGPQGRGTMGSRSLQLGGSALREAAGAVKEMVLAEAAQLLELSATDLTIEDAVVRPVDSPDLSVPLTTIVNRYLERNSRTPSDTAVPNSIVATSRYEADGETFPFGSTLVIVSVDRETGRPTVERFVAVDDVGNVVNPLLVEGQIIGGAAQGIGETLWEQVVYDQSGQLLSGTLMDYAVPKATWLPSMELERMTTPTPRNPLGAKGVGEAGTVHAPPAVANAVVDALRPFGVRSIDLPITDQKLWQIIHTRN